MADAAAATPARVFITGASGFIGRRLMERYRELGSEVRGVDVRADPELDVVAGDVTEPGDWQDHAGGCDLMVHTAAVIGFGGRYERYWRVNGLGTRNALDAAERAGVRRFLHLSSIVVFGIDFPDGVDETYPVRTTGSPYTDTKIVSEQAVLATHAAGRVPCTIVRPGDVYGPRSWPWAISIVEAVKAGPLALPEGGRGILSPVYVDNLVDGIVLAGASPAADGQVFTLTDGTGIENREYFGRFCEWLGKPPPRSLPASVLKAATWPIAKAAELRGGESNLNPATIEYMRRHGTYSITKARELLGYEPRVGLDEGMERTRRWLADEGMLS
jgi:nucleoside-diphosphate-sugar epimerase